MTRILTGTYLEPDGTTAQAGTLELTRVRTVNGDVDRIFPTDQLTATLGEDGAFSLTVQPGVWKVRERIGRGAIYRVLIPEGTSSIDLADLSDGSPDVILDGGAPGDGGTILDGGEP